MRRQGPRVRWLVAHDLGMSQRAILPCTILLHIACRLLEKVAPHDRKRVVQMLGRVSR